MNLVVLGASGGVGRLVVREAHARGHRVTAVVRPESDVPFPAEVDVLRGDVLDRETIEDAVDGMDAVVVALGLRRRFPLSPWSDVISPPDLTARAATYLVDAMRNQGVRRVVAISAAGVGDSWARTNMVMRKLVRSSNLGVAYADLAAMEKILEGSALDWMAVRPVTLTNLPWPEHAVITEHYGATSNVPRAAVARFMLSAVEGAAALVDRTPMITGGAAVHGPSRASNAEPS